MAKKGQTVNNALTGERYVFIETSSDTAGKLLKYEYYLELGAPVALEHFHPETDENFRVVKGQITFLINGKEQVVNAGEEIMVPAGVRHTGWNSGEGEMCLVAEVLPAFDYEDYIITCAGLAREGKTNKRGMPNFLQIAVFGLEMKNQTFLPSHVWAQKIYFNVFGRLAKGLGYKARYERFMEQGTP